MTYVRRRCDACRRLKVWQLCCSLGPACNVNCMSCFWSPGGPPQATGTCDLYRCWVSGWTSSSSLMRYKVVSEFSMKFDLHSTWSQSQIVLLNKRVQCKLPAWLVSEPASKYGVRTQFNLHYSAVCPLLLRAVHCHLSALTENGSKRYVVLSLV